MYKKDYIRYDDNVQKALSRLKMEKSILHFMRWASILALCVDLQYLELVVKMDQNTEG